MATLRLRYVNEYIDRHGKVRRYFRRAGQPRIPLPGLPGSREFIEAYQAALNSEPPRTVAAGEAGSLSELVANFYKSPRFANLAESSKVTYRKALGPILEKDGAGPARDLPRDKAAKIIAEIGETRPGMANLTKKVLQTVFKFAVRTGVRDTNPFVGVDLYRLGTHHTWTDAELTGYERRWPVGTRERLAYAALLYLGQRVGDAVRMSLTDIKHNAIKVVQEKTAEDEDDAQWIELHPELVRAIEAAKKNGLLLIGNKRHGGQIQGRSLSAIIKTAAKAAGLPPRCKAHGLRKANSRILAEHGATVKEMQSVSGHKTLTELQRYSDRASRKKMSKSAIGKWPNGERG